MRPEHRGRHARQLFWGWLAGVLERGQYSVGLPQKRFCVTVEVQTELATGCRLWWNVQPATRAIRQIRACVPSAALHLGLIAPRW